MERLCRSWDPSSKACSSSPECIYPGEAGRSSHCGEFEDIRV